MKVEYMTTIQGSSEENEDAVGQYENYCWIIDGATDLFDCVNLIGFSVGEVVCEISKRIPFFCDDKKSLKEIFALAVGEVARKMLINLEQDSTLFAKMPTFSLVFCRQVHQNLEYILIGDCFLIVNNQIITDIRISDFSKKNKKRLEVIKKERGSIPYADRLNQLQSIRMKANVSEGYPIGSLNPDSINQVISGELQLPKSECFLIMSDGYYYNYDTTKDLGEVSNFIEFELGNNELYGKRDDASVIMGRID